MATTSQSAACSSTTSHTTSRGRARINSTIREVKRIKRPKFREKADGNRPHLSRMFDKAPLPPRQLPKAWSGRGRYPGVGLGFQREQVRRDRRRMMLFPRGDHRGEEAAVIHGRTEPVERLEMFRHRVALVALETVTR